VRSFVLFILLAAAAAAADPSITVALVRTPVEQKTETTPVDILATTRIVEVGFGLSEAEVEKLGTSFTMNLWVSESGGPRRYYGGMTWNSGPFTGKFGGINQSPVFSAGPFDSLAGKATVWIEFTPSAALNIELTLTQSTRAVSMAGPDEHHSIAYVAAFGFAQCTGCASLTTPSRTTSAGNSIIPVFSSWREGGVTLTFTDNKSGSYVTDAETSTNNEGAHIGHDHNTSGGSGHTVTGTPDQDAWARMNAFEYSGMSDENAEASNTNTGTGTSASSGAVTASANAVTVGTMTQGGTGTTLTLTSSGWTERAEDEDVDGGQPLNAGDKTSAGASETATWTLGASRAWAGAIVSYKEAAAAATRRRLVVQ
jgi:hypothetical protein